jgi:hypothetical protein
MGLRVIVRQLNDGQPKKVDASNEAFADFSFPITPTSQNPSTFQLSVPNLQLFDLSWRAKAPNYTHETTPL